jgi:hypothetical protein
VTTSEEESCPYCNSAIELRDSSVIYGKSYGPVWICTKYPACDAYVGCHPGTTVPFGRMANAELREARKTAHAKFDPIWKHELLSRKDAYRELARRMGVDEIHIGESDVETCKRIAEQSEVIWHEYTQEAI